MIPKDLDPKTKKVMSACPVRNPVKWRMENGLAVIIYKKSLTNMERKIKNFVGGPDNIRRPLDDKGTDIWLLCDGDHTIIDICQEMDKKYKEDMEPVVKRVGKFIEMLLKLNLVSLRSAGNDNDEKKDGKKKRDRPRPTAEGPPKGQRQKKRGKN